VVRACNKIHVPGVAPLAGGGSSSAAGGYSGASVASGPSRAAASNKGGGAGRKGASSVTAAASSASVATGPAVGPARKAVRGGGATAAPSGASVAGSIRSHGTVSVSAAYAPSDGYGYSGGGGSGGSAYPNHYDNTVYDAAAAPSQRSSHRYAADDGGYGLPSESPLAASNGSSSVSHARAPGAAAAGAGSVRSGVGAAKPSHRKAPTHRDDDDDDSDDTSSDEPDTDDDVEAEAAAAARAAAAAYSQYSAEPWKASCLAQCGHRNLLKRMLWFAASASSGSIGCGEQPALRTARQWRRQVESLYKFIVWLSTLHFWPVKSVSSSHLDSLISRRWRQWRCSAAHVPNCNGRRAGPARVRRQAQGRPQGM
jgi:hypothetical protein